MFFNFSKTPSRAAPPEPGTMRNTAINLAISFFPGKILQKFADKTDIIRELSLLRLVWPSPRETPLFPPLLLNGGPGPKVPGSGLTPG
jgi:hypothetical protein